MRHIMVLAIAAIFWLAMLIFKQHKEKLMILGVIVLSLVGGVYCYAKADSMLSDRQARTQTFYSTDYLESGEFPDAFLRLYLNGKTVHVKNDKMTLKESEEKEYNWLYSYYHVHNMVNYLESVNANIISEDELNSYSIGDEKKSDFEKLGYSNDLLRNTVMYTKNDVECGNYFYYLWYYRDLADVSYIYMNVDSLDEDELVLIWQPVDSREVVTEDMYIMGKSYFENNIK